MIRLGLDARKLTDFGIGTYVQHLVAGLAPRSDIELSLVVRPGHEGRARELAPRAHVIPSAAAGYSVAEHIAVPVALWGHRVQLVHIPHYVVPVLLMRPTVVTIHDVIQLFYPPQRHRTLALVYLRTMVRLALRRARRAITVSRTTRASLVQLFGADPAGLTVVSNGVDPALAERPPREELERLKAMYGLRPPLVLCVANDKPHKNLDLVLRAFHLAVRRHGVPGQLVFVGGPVVGSPFAERVARLGLEERVRLVGRVSWSDLVAFYHLAATLLHVALYEGFGLPILEAMRAGLPVITSNLGAMRELGEGAARLVSPLDVEEVAAAIERVLVDDPLRRRMVEAGRRKADKLPWEATVEATVAVYRKALGEARK